MFCFRVWFWIYFANWWEDHWSLWLFPQGFFFVGNLLFSEDIFGAVVWVFFVGSVWQISVRDSFFKSVLEILANCLVPVVLVLDESSVFIWLIIAVLFADWTRLLCLLGEGVHFHILFHYFPCFEKCYISFILYLFGIPLSFVFTAKSLKGRMVILEVSAFGFFGTIFLYLVRVVLAALFPCQTSCTVLLVVSIFLTFKVL